MADPSKRPVAGSVTGPARRNKHHKRVNIALQGGGAHGAFTWGVLDRFFEDDRIWIDRISGTSAGAMNTVVASHGMYDGGAEGARDKLLEFWSAVSGAARFSPLQRPMWARAMGNWSLESSPGFLALSLMQRLASPYDLNPFDFDPLRDILARIVDFNKVRDCKDMGVFLSATNVETGRLRIFARDEIDLDVTMASACLPSMFKAVEIDGAPYWDGGFIGNPPLTPFFNSSCTNDIIIVQINPVVRQGTPRTASDIQNRMNEITFNASLLHELRSIYMLQRLVDAGQLDSKAYRKLNIHVVSADMRMAHLDASSKLNAEWEFLRHLFEIGRATATAWLTENFDLLGTRSSFDLHELFAHLDLFPEQPTGRERAPAAPASPGAPDT